MNALSDNRNIEPGVPDSALRTADSKMARRALILIWFAVLCSSTSSTFVRFSTCPSLVLAAWRKTFVTLLLLPVVMGNPSYRTELKSLNRSQVIRCIISGCFLAIHFWTYFLSVHNTTITAAHVLVNLEVLFVAIFMFLSGRERYSRRSIAGIFIAIFGGIVVAYTKGGLNMAGMMFGNLLAIIAAVMVASYSFIGTGVRGEGVSNNVYTFLVYGTSAVVLDLMVLISPYHFTGYGRINYLLAFGMAIVNSLLGHSIFNWSLKYQSPTLVAMIKLFQPVFSTILGLIIFSELPLWNQFIGGIVVITGISLYIKHKK